MNMYELVQLVVEMREAQKDYFSERTRSALTRAKHLERRVDEELLRLTNTLPVMSRLPGFEVEEGRQ